MTAEQASQELEQLEVQKLHHNLFSMYSANAARWQQSVDNAEQAIDELETVVKGLVLLHGTIKSNILPSLNAMASQMLDEMTEGKHPEIELTESMDILVDGETIDALSGSGKAVSHLALRLALGSILTSRVFPVALFDEVDAGMDVKRSGNVMSLLGSMLDRFQQVFVISHKTLENVNQTINL
jgi:DNA repair exonuclease SbcCD ATPase subunit